MIKKIKITIKVFAVPIFRYLNLDLEEQKIDDTYEEKFKNAGFVLWLFNPFFNFVKET